MTVETEIRQLEWIDDEMAIGFVMIDGRRWKAVVTKNEYCKQCDGKGGYMTDDPHIKNEYIEIGYCEKCDGTGVMP